MFALQELQILREVPTPVLADTKTNNSKDSIALQILHSYQICYRIKRKVYGNLFIYYYLKTVLDHSMNKGECD